jgi:hypothetical protein
MPSEFLTFQKFKDRGLALELGALLEENGIEYEMDDKTDFGLGFADSEMIKEYRIRLRKEDFSKADELLQRAYAKEVDSAEKDHYLFSFTDEELMDIINKRDEWSPFDFMLAQKILRERGKEIKPEAIAAIDKQRIEELAKQERSPDNWIFIGYALTLMGALGGFFIAWHLTSYKKTLPNGETVYGYAESVRKHGNRIFILSIIVLGILVVRWVWKNG